MSLWAGPGIYFDNSVLRAWADKKDAAVKARPNLYRALRICGVPLESANLTVTPSLAMEFLGVKPRNMPSPPRTTFDKTDNVEVRIKKVLADAVNHYNDRFPNLNELNKRYENQLSFSKDAPPVLKLFSAAIKPQIETEEDRQTLIKNVALNRLLEYDFRAPAIREVLPGNEWAKKLKPEQAIHIAVGHQLVKDTLTYRATGAGISVFRLTNRLIELALRNKDADESNEAQQSAKYSAREDFVDAELIEFAFFGLPSDKDKPFICITFDAYGQIRTRVDAAEAFLGWAFKILERGGFGDQLPVIQPGKIGILSPGTNFPSAVIKCKRP